MKLSINHVRYSPLMDCWIIDYDSDYMGPAKCQYCRSLTKAIQKLQEWKSEGYITAGDIDNLFINRQIHFNPPMIFETLPQFLNRILKN